MKMLDKEQNHATTDRSVSRSMVEALRMKHEAGTAFDFTPFYKGESDADDYTMSSSYEFSEGKLNIAVYVEDTEEAVAGPVSDWVWTSVANHMINDSLSHEEAEQHAVEDNNEWFSVRAKQFHEFADIAGMRDEIIEELAPAFIGEEFVVGSDEWAEAFDYICRHLDEGLHIIFGFIASEPFTADMYLEQWENRSDAEKNS